MANEALANSLRVSRDLHSAHVPLELRHADQLQRMATWSMSQPAMAVVNQVREGVEALLERASKLPG